MRWLLLLCIIHFFIGCKKSDVEEVEVLHLIFEEEFDEAGSWELPPYYYHDAGIEVLEIDSRIEDGLLKLSTSGCMTAWAKLELTDPKFTDEKYELLVVYIDAGGGFAGADFEMYIKDFDMKFCLGNINQSPWTLRFIDQQPMEEIVCLNVGQNPDNKGYLYFECRDKPGPGQCSSSYLQINAVRIYGKR